MKKWQLLALLPAIGVAVLLGVSPGSWRWVTSIAGSIALIYALWGYVSGIKQGLIKPHVWTWCVFFVSSGGGAIYTAVKHGGVTGAMVPFVLTAVIGYVLWLLWKHPEYRHKGYEKWYHPWAVVIALTVYACQFVFHFSSLYAALAAVGVDVTAIGMQWVKSWNYPNSELVAPWAWGSLGGLLGLISLEEWNIVSFIWPTYFLLSNLGIVLILKWRQPRVPLLHTTKAGA